MSLKVLAAIYYNPDLYPPTLNAVSEISKIADIDIIYRPNKDSNWYYPENVNLFPSDNPLDLSKQEKSNVIRKFIFFFKFSWKLRNHILKHKPNVIVLYDYIPLFAYYLSKFTLSHKPAVWYHNHDVTESGNLRKLSIGWFAHKAESKMFPHIDLFTLPATERKKYFPLEKLKGRFLFLPNLPQKQFYQQFVRLYHNDNSLRLLYQGSISEGHGLESIISILSHRIDDKKLKLHLAGRISDSYRNKLISIAKKFNVLEQIIFHEVIPYCDLPNLTVSCDIGISIHEPIGIIYQTGGTASNKIYEYAACGLPVLYLDNPHYNAHLKQYEWAISTNLNPECLRKSIKYIYENHLYLSTQAKKDFANNLNFETAFNPIRNFLSSMKQING